jgi:hypothetical protein
VGVLDMVRRHSTWVSAWADAGVPPELPSPAEGSPWGSEIGALEQAAASAARAESERLRWGKQRVSVRMTVSDGMGGRPVASPASLVLEP